MIQRVVACLHVEGLTGNDLWHLISLTWVTKSGREVSLNYWRKYKVPALNYLFRKGQQKQANHHDLAASIAAIGPPDPVEEAATKETGIVNFFPAYRNSALDWCKDHAANLRSLVRDTAKLGSDNQARFELAEKIGKLPAIPRANGGPASAPKLITPFIASLDPLSRFPVVNGKPEVNRLLRNMQLVSHNLETQVKGLVGLIDWSGILTLT